MPERACELSVIGHPKNDDSQAQDALKMKRTYGRKRYEDLQSVSIGTVEYPTTSCSVMSSGGLANGADPGSLAPPTARLPPRLVAKDVWPQGHEPGRERSQSQEQPWNPSRDRGPEQTWAAGRERPQEQAGTGAPNRPGVLVEKEPRNKHGTQAGIQEETGPPRHQSRDGTQAEARIRLGALPVETEDKNKSGDLRKGSRHNLAMKKVQRVEMERNPPVISYPQPPGRESGSDSVNVGSSAEPSTAQPSEELKPPILSTKKEPPTYPPGSQEERWQLQIVAKGRVTCPKCKSVSRKTVEGLKKHMENCRLQPFTCQHCGKQLKSSTGMKYHIMADHSHLPSPDDGNGLDDRAIKDKLRKILKRLGKLKCSREGCNAAFTSIMGYLYHMRKCGKEESELEKLVLNCSHCGKAYKSKAGLEYHLKSEHAPVSALYIVICYITPQQNEEEETLKAQREANPERTASGRVQRASAQVANFHLAEIANNELPKDWPKRKFQSDLVPDDKKLKYARPGLPAFSQEVLRKWKNEVKLQRKVQCPNQGCGCTYTSVSGLKAHLGLCTRGDFEAGKYRCLICSKEFNSESGVKYHINSVHSQDWFVTNKKASKKFEKFLKNQPKEFVHSVDKQIIEQFHQHHLHHHLQHHQQHHHHHHHHHQHLQHQPVQQPLQPLHHLQHQAQLLHPEHQQHHQIDPQLQQQLQPLLHYTPLEPPAGPVWVDMDRRGAVAGADQAPMEMGMPAMDKPGGESSGAAEGKRREKGERGGERGAGERGKAEGKRKDLFAYGGGGGSGGSSSSSSSSSSNTGSSSSESEVEQHDRQRQIDQWNLKRPGIMEVNPEVAKRHRSNT
ncbi:uncharacterized protein znf512 [Polymixia lowei]